MKYPRYIHRIILLALSGAVFFVMFAYEAEKKSNLLTVYVLDVGIGEALYVRTPGGRDILVDAGASREILRRLSEVMPWYDDDLDLVFETHADMRHAGGLPDVFLTYNVAAFVYPKIPKQSPIQEEIRKVVNSKSIDSIETEKNIRIDVHDGTTLAISVSKGTLSLRLSYASSTIELSGNHRKTLEAMNGRKIPVLDTEELGTIAFTTDGNGWRRVK